MQDLIIRLNEQRDVLQLLVPKKGGKVEKLRVFYEIAANEIPNTESLESHLGSIVLAFLSVTSTAKSFHLDQYRQAGKDFGQFMSNEAAELLDSGDADSEFDGALLRLNLFDDTWSLEDIDGITALLARAAENGSEKAAQFLRDDWPARSKMLKKRLGRATGN
ncbi:hypothetical protein [Nostoc linckia]|uniref:hypothetical protein n=1 Tax=Bacteria TaxID=2 RepID=UPI00117DF3F9|nr:hypothetical protein [Nostoc linckia]